MARVVCAARHPVDLSSGRSLGPGETADDIDVDDDEHNKQLVDNGRLVVLTVQQSPPAGPSPRTNPTDGGST